MQVKQTPRRLLRHLSAVVHFILFLLICSFAGPVVSCSCGESESSIPLQEEEDPAADPAIDPQPNSIRRQPVIPAFVEISNRTGSSKLSLPDASSLVFGFAEGRSAPQRC